MGSSLLYTDAIGQVQVGLSLNVGNRQHYSTSEGFKRALAPSGSLSINQNLNLNHNWIFRYGVVGGIVGYRLNVVMIDTLGENGDVSPFPEYSVFFGSAEFLLGRKISFLNKDLLLGAGVGITGYVSAIPLSTYTVAVISTNNQRIPLFDAEMNNAASRYSFLWKGAAYYKLNSAFSLGVEYIYHKDPVATGFYIFYHTKKPNAGKIEIYQREVRIGLFYRIGSRSDGDAI
ncbi:MAG TPA: hypothetical protein VGD65_02210 [Chryseosolibacter sp.]